MCPWGENKLSARLSPWSSGFTLFSATENASVLPAQGHSWEDEVLSTVLSYDQVGCSDYLTLHTLEMEGLRSDSGSCRQAMMEQRHRTCCSDCSWQIVFCSWQIVSSSNLKVGLAGWNGWGFFGNGQVALSGNASAATETSMEAASFPRTEVHGALARAELVAPRHQEYDPCCFLYKNARGPEGAVITSTRHPESRRALGPKKAHASCLSLLRSWPRAPSQLLPTSIRQAVAPREAGSLTFELVPLRREWSCRILDTRQASSCLCLRTETLSLPEAPYQGTDWNQDDGFIEAKS